MLTEFPYWFLASIAIALGLLLGSFLNVVVHRLPRGESIVSPGSRCPACGKPIRAFQNVPLVSWLVLRGRAGCCGARISARYPLLELLGGLCAWAVLEKTLADGGDGLAPLALFAVHLALGLGLLAAVFIDLEHMLLPDEITLGGAALGLCTASLRGVPWGDSLVGAAVGFLVVWLPFVWLYRRIRGFPGMGVGDAKLLCLAGAWFGWPGAVFALLAGAVQGTLVAIAVVFAKGRLDEPEAVKRERAEIQAELGRLEGEERARFEAEIALDPIAREPEPGLGQARLAFGPFLALGILEYLFLGKELVAEASWLLVTR